MYGICTSLIKLIHQYINAGNGPVLNVELVSNETIKSNNNTCIPPLRCIMMVSYSSLPVSRIGSLDIVTTPCAFLECTVNRFFFPIVFPSVACFEKCFTTTCKKRTTILPHQKQLFEPKTPQRRWWRRQQFAVFPLRTMVSKGYRFPRVSSRRPSR